MSTFWQRTTDFGPRCSCGLYTEQIQDALGEPWWACPMCDQGLPPYPEIDD